jgi:ectoine hydroxylase-related dioxygenase (phytanoyl-CoA dioxygenase family)
VEAEQTPASGVDAMTFVSLHDAKSPAQELIESGELGSETTPQNIAALRGAGYSELPVSKGDLVLIHGLVDHLSLANNSTDSRHTFQLHLVDTVESAWRSSNWQQYPADVPFPRMHPDTFSS